MKIDPLVDQVIRFQGRCWRLGGNAVTKQPPDRQPPMAQAMRWVSEITSGGLMLALPSLGGWWLDGRFGTAPWCLVVGGMFGLATSFLHILKVTGAMKSVPQDKR